MNEDTGKNTLDTVNFIYLKQLVMKEEEKTKLDQIKMLIIIKYLYEREKVEQKQEQEQEQEPESV